MFQYFQNLCVLNKKDMIDSDCYFQTMQQLQRRRKHAKRLYACYCIRGLLIERDFFEDRIFSFSYRSNIYAYDFNNSGMRYKKRPRKHF